MPAPVTAKTKYEPEFGWAKLPHPMTFKEATSVAVDSKDNVYVFNRGKWPLMKFDKQGNFITTWGAGDFDRPHGIRTDKDDNLYLIDDVAHMVEKRTTDGKLLMRLGERGKAAAKQEGDPFNRPTDVAVHPVSGDIFVSDGYGNSRVHRFDKNGKHILSWGEPGSREGQFSLPHNICFVGNDKVAVCDRENFRLQVFTLDGKYVQQVHAHRPIAMFGGGNAGSNIFVAEAGPPAVQAGVKRLGECVRVFDSNFNELVRFGNELPGEGPDQFIAPHGMAVDSEGSVYVAEVSYTSYSSHLEPPREVVSLRKWKRVSG
jgi:DNA-binding beta-propeller fold protein YncE